MQKWTVGVSGEAVVPAVHSPFVYMGRCGIEGDHFNLNLCSKRKHGQMGPVGPDSSILNTYITDPAGDGAVDVRVYINTGEETNYHYGTVFEHAQLKWKHLYSRTVCGLPRSQRARAVLVDEVSRLEGSLRPTEQDSRWQQTERAS